LRSCVEALVRFHALGGNACRCIADVFDGGVDIVAAFWVGYHGISSVNGINWGRCFVQASVESVDIDIDKHAGDDGLNVLDMSCWG